ncbi:hypothetical protein [Micromonospora sp. Llam0]|uniref:hypothetical protein n=1 Tax=Micromonospora sp. Llam0 TaxID=2485143 RepID=UPI000F46A12B|nr:hypothetical protein [Micromonospora sp. Llam0]
MTLLIVAAACLVVAALAAIVRRSLIGTAEDQHEGWEMHMGDLRRVLFGTAEDRHEGWDMHTGELSALRVELTQDLPAPAPLPWPEPVDGERWPEPVTGRTASAGAVYRSQPVPVPVPVSADAARHRAEPSDDGTGQWTTPHPQTAGVNPWFAQHVARSAAARAAAGGGSW